MDTYAPITRDSAMAIQAFTSQLADTISCDCTAGTLLTWCGPQGGAVRVGDNWLSAYWPKYGMLGFPLTRDGTRPGPEDVRAEVEALRATGATLNLVIDAPLDWAEAATAAPTADRATPWFTIEAGQGMRDYIYAASDLADLPGSKYSAKRNLIHQFEREHPGWRVEPLAPSPLSCPRLKRFIEEWRLTAADPSGSLGADLAALETAFHNWDTGIFQGLSLIADDPERGQDALLAFAVFSVPTRDMADIHFEKAVHGVKGASQLINRETARVARAAGVSWINREQDMGVPGLRRAKMDYHPAYLMPTCALRL